MPPDRRSTPSVRAARRRLALLLPLVPALLCARAAAAQVVTGTLLAEDSRLPIDAAVVYLLRGEERAASSFTDAAGAFTLRAPAPGTYRLRAERIGFETATSEALDVTTDGLRYTFVVPVRVVRLDGIVVQAETQCRPTREAPDVAIVWEEARKALDAVALTERDALVRSAIVAWERELDAATLAPTREIERVRAVRSRIPIRSLPADDLAGAGYVREGGAGIDWYAPDAEVLLSQSFLATHCFRLRADPDRPDRIGLAFSPTAASPHPDIDGVLWLYRATSELRELEYRYVRLPWDVRHDGIGGHVAFERVGGGPWIVRRWQIRMPVLQRRVMSAGAMRIASFRESGSEVVDIVQALGRRVAAPDVARATTPAPTGIARAAGARADSAAAPPDSVYTLEGVTVEVEARSATLERTGFYTRLSSVVGGRFFTPEQITARNPRRVSDLLESAPGVRLREVRQGSGRVLWFAGTERPSGSGITLCGPRVYLDGIVVFPGGTGGGPAPIDELIGADLVAAIEVYRGGASLPAQYAGAETACGVLLIWTGARGPPPPPAPAPGNRD